MGKFGGEFAGEFGGVLAEGGGGSGELPGGGLGFGGGAGGADGAVFDAGFDDEVAGGELGVMDDVVDVLDDAGDAAECGEATEERPALHAGDFAGGAGEDGGHVFGVAADVRDEVFAFGGFGEVEEAHGLRPVVPVAEAEVDLAIGGLPERSGFATGLAAGGAAAPADVLVDGADAPGMEGEGEGLDLAEVKAFRPVRAVASQEGGCGHDKAGGASDVAALAAGHLEWRFVAVGVDVGPAGAGAGGEVVAGACGKRAIEAVGGDGEVDRICREVCERGLERLAEGGGGGDDDIGGGNECGEAVGVFDDDGAFVPVGVGVERGALRAGLVIEERRLVAEGVAFGGFDEDDVGAVVTEEACGECAGESVGEVDDTDVVVGAGHVVVSPLIGGWGR